jgi:hypothetical protein
MSKWSRLKVALLVAGGTLAHLAIGDWGSCLGADWYQRVVQYTVIGNLFD